MKKNKITVIIPTYRRPKELKRCLEGLKKQERPADEIIIVFRDNDFETKKLLKKKKKIMPLLHIIKVNDSGAVKAYNAGLNAAQGDIIAITDDDAIPHPDWLTHIESHFLSDDKIGGVGGRDLMYVNKILQKYSIHPGASNIVGKVLWFGKIIGNHHIGVGTSREVDILKGVNMSYRRTAVKDLYFDERMRGTGAQVHFECAFTLTLKHLGWKIIYDPKIKVNHYLAQRFDEDQREQFNKIAWSNRVHNETLSLLEYFSLLQKAIFILWAIFIGTRNAFGFVQLLRFLPKEGKISISKFISSMYGRWLGWKTWQNTKK